MSVWKACPVPLDLHIPASTSGKRSLAYRYVSVAPFILHGPGFQFLNDESSLLLIHHYEHLIPFHERESFRLRELRGNVDPNLLVLFVGERLSLYNSAYCLQTQPPQSRSVL